ncbi:MULTISPECIES: hypothetical protein [Dactylosporangium]|uniref:Uncharacterized protein n=2 Tax=Dactylosporangium TaxID=35753 RepID=A0A9W6KPP3_9ACTN|nr:MULTISPECIES: hypothetical protein [Dactylosporangium]UAB99266.1 hypothetical protein Dvina_15015 [Dactylosporangium vinaceum]UWZ47498.1 hypothetical protein Dmats_14475 [Dactylosporangium matsuzakiense]GLL05258.1 hypothetical protein GCM10017581_070050 [Dactylosporangium matsuzakiense]
MPSRPPDDALARLARWDELRRRAAGGRAAADAPHREPPQPQPDPAPQPALDDLVQTLRALARRHPSLSLAVVAEDAGAVWHMRTTQTDAGIEIRPAAAGTPSTAARLADLLREHPRILDDPNR